MKRIRIALLVLALALIAAFLLWRNLNHTSDVGLRDFAVEHPEKVTKVFFSPNNSKLPELVFTKKAHGIWFVSNKTSEFPADTSSIQDLLFYVLANLETQNPVNDATVDKITRDLANDGIKVQVFVGDKMVKTFYAGGPTYDQLGTYMYLPGSKRPCIVTVPAHRGYLTPYFNTQINNWRSSVIFNTAAADIAQISVIWANDPAASFLLEQKNNDVVLTNLAGSAISNFNRNAVLAYLEMFVGVTREGGDLPGINKNKAVVDSILRSQPFFTIYIKNKNGKSDKLQLYYRKVTDETYSQQLRTGELKKFETETYWATINGGREIWIIQDAIFKNRMKKSSDFIRN